MKWSLQSGNGTRADVDNKKIKKVPEFFLGLADHKDIQFGSACSNEELSVPVMYSLYIKLK